MADKIGTSLRIAKDIIQNHGSLEELEKRYKLLEIDKRDLNPIIRSKIKDQIEYIPIDAEDKSWEDIQGYSKLASAISPRGFYTDEKHYYYSIEELENSLSSIGSNAKVIIKRFGLRGEKAKTLQEVSDEMSFSSREVARRLEAFGLKSLRHPHLRKNTKIESLEEATRKYEELMSEIKRTGNKKRGRPI